MILLKNLRDHLQLVFNVYHKNSNLIKYIFPFSYPHAFQNNIQKKELVFYLYNIISYIGISISVRIKLNIILYNADVQKIIIYLWKIVLLTN
jgi:hypothetical protein